jgi:hypothetical protein
VVISKLHVVSFTVAPNKADPPLIIDPNAELTSPITTQRLKPIAGHDPQLFQALRRMDDLELPARPRDEASVDTLDESPLEQRRRARVSEAPDHTVT